MTEQGRNSVVGIIGAGVAGLCAARHVQAVTGWRPVVWEQSQDLGGTWRLSEQVGVDHRGYPVHSSLYNNMRTDLPAVMMGFPDYKFPEKEAFMHHTTVLKYLENYAEHFSLLPFIKFGHRVEEVTHRENLVDGREEWMVTVKDLSAGHTHTITCHALLVCNGHFSEPNIPEIEGIGKYQGQSLHSHDYREPSPFVNKRVVVLGGGPSGLDIALELASVADKVFLSHNFPLMIPSEFPSNLYQVQPVVTGSKKGFVLSDGTHLEADVIIYCTGYKYKFPFLMDECGIKVEDNHVRDLYKHIINIRHPTMGFIGLPSRVIVFLIIHYQVQYFLATLEGKVTLPPFEEMLSLVHKTQQERKKQGLPQKHTHSIAFEQFEYIADLATEADLDHPPPFIPGLLKTVLVRLFFSFPTFKNYNYYLAGDGALVETYRGQRVATGRNLAWLVITQSARYLWRDFPRVVTFFASIIMKKMKTFFRL